MADQNDLIEKFPFCDPNKRHDFVFFFDVRDGNPNGDPDAGNLPRMDPSDRRGIVTDVCMKRKVRDYLASALHQPIHIQSEVALNSLYGAAARHLVANGNADVRDAYVEVDVGNDNLKLFLQGKDQNPQDPSAETLVEARAWLEGLDVEGIDYEPPENANEPPRLVYFGEAKKKDFKPLLEGAAPLEGERPPWLTAMLTNVAGALAAKKQGVLSREAKDVVKREMCRRYIDIRLFGAVLTFGTNAGQVRGPMQLTFGRSVEPILRFEAAITRCAITKHSDWLKKQTEFGRKPWLNYALYRQHGFFNPFFAKQTKLDATDLLRFWVALGKMLDHDKSAARGEMRMQDIIVFTHKNARGDVPSHKLLDRVHVKPVHKGEPSRVFDLDYQVCARTRDESGNDVCESLEDHKWEGGLKPHRPMARLAIMEASLPNEAEGSGA